MQQPLPNNLIEALKNINGFDEKKFKEIHQSGEQVTSIRLNPAKQNEQLSILRSVTASVPWCKYGRYLAQRPSFTFDPHFHAGAYYVQEASSMFLWKILEQKAVNTTGLKVLDLCAAPGGKSTLLSSYFTNSLIVANETIKSRANILAENVAKWGNENIVVTNNDPKDFSKLAGFFDVIVIDAPCSGSGLFRKDNNAIAEWSEENVMLCSQRQQRILADAIPALKQNGLLIYSTCSYSAEEDESICDWLITNYDLSSLNCLTNVDWNIVETISAKKTYGYRFYSYNLSGEGFFIAAFKKNDGEIFSEKTGKINSASQKEKDIALNWIKENSELSLIKHSTDILALPASISEHLAFLQKHLYIKKAGINIGTIKGNNMVPHHELAISNILNKNIPVLNVSKENAIKYLQKKEMDIAQRFTGWHVICFEGSNIGWVKVLPNRINNYYPMDWRILKQ